MPDLNNILLYVFMGLCGLSALFIMFTKNILYAAIALMITFLSMAVIFIFLGAEFVAITQILVYVGGILILLVFGIMLTNKTGTNKVISLTYNKVLGFVASGALFIILFKGITLANFSALGWNKDSTLLEPSISSFGKILMTDYVIAFEIIGLLLLLALIGAVRIAGKARKEVNNGA